MANLEIVTSETTVELAVISGAQQSDITSAVNAHAALTTGVHGVGASTVDSAANRDAAIAAHNASATAHVDELVNYNAACDWYVDSINGSDSNNGFTPSAAFATIAKLLTVLQAGDVVGLVRGSKWNEQLTIAVNNVKVLAVGNGQPPIFDSADVVLNASFTKTVGRTNLYQVTVTTNFTASEPQFVRVWEDSVGLPIATSEANCDATPRSYWVATHDAVSVTVYVHASSSANVTTNGRLYEISKRTSGVYSFFASGTTVDGVTCKRPCGNGGGIKVGPFSTVSNCRVDDANKHNFHGLRGTNFNNCIAFDAYYNSDSTAFVLNDDTPSGQSSTFESCQAIMPRFNSLMTGFYGHKNVSGSFGTVTFSNCSTLNCAIGFAFADSSRVVYNNCSGTDNRYDFSLANPGTYAIVGGNFISAQASSGFINNVTSVITLSIAKVKSSKDDIQNAHVFASVASTISITDSIFISTKTTTTNQNTVYFSVGGGTLYCRNNNYRAPGVTNGPYIYFLTTTTTLDSDYNTFEEADMWFNVNGGNYGTLAAYQAGTGQDANSVVG